MPPRDPQVVLQKLDQKTLKVDGFFLRRTGFVANQTVLKLGEYNLNLVPATISLVEGRFLAVLSSNEVSFFTQFKEGTHILILTFANGDTRDIKRFPIRVSLTSMTPVPERKNVCFLDLRFKSLSSEFILFLGTYQEELEARQESWEKLGDQLVEMTPALAVAVGAGFGFVLVAGPVRASVDILSFHTKLIRLALPEGSPAFAEGTGLQLKVAFQGRPLSLDGTLGPENTFVPEFNPDWLTFVEECHFQVSLQSRAKKAP